MNKAVIAVAAACAASLNPLGGASATTLSPLWWGVERILVSCTGDQSVSDALRARLCAEMVTQLRGRTGFPAAVRETAERRDPEADLIVRMNASLAPDRGDGRAVLVLSIRPHRYGTGPGRAAEPARIVEGAFGDQSQATDLERLIAESLDAILPGGGGTNRLKV